MKIRKRLSAFFSLLVLVSMLIAPMQVGATTQNDAVLEARQGIVQVMFSAQNADKEYEDLYGGTGFLIGVEETGAQYVITNHHVIEPFDKAYWSGKDALQTEKDAVWDYLGISYDKEIKTKIRIVLKRDTYVDVAEVIDSSRSMDFAVLKLEQPVYGDRKPLVLADSDQLKETQDVYALGFPAIVQAMQDSQLYTSSDVNINDGKVSKLAESVLIDEPIPCINHSATITDGNSGGPLVNENGEVVGVNRHTDATGTYFYSVQINEISEVLDLRGIEYTKAGESAPVIDEPAEEAVVEEVETEEAVEETEEAAEEVDKSELETAVEDAEAIDVATISEESLEETEFEDVLDDAKDILEKEDATAEEVDNAAEALETAMKGLVEAPKGLSPMVIVGIAAVAIVVIVIIVVVVVSSNNKKKQAAAAAQKKQAAMAGAYGGPKPPVAPTPAYAPPKPPVAPSPMMMDDGSAETGVLNDGSTETTVLGGQVPSAYLIRRKNNERITITKQIFKIGKERRKVDYCVADNTNVSRTHADIVYRNGEFYVVDNNATNGTSVNGVSVPAGQDRILKNNDIVKLADEEFQFRTF